MKLKIRLVAVAAFVALLGLTACGSKDRTASSLAAASDPTTTAPEVTTTSTASSGIDSALATPAAALQNTPAPASSAPASPVGQLAPPVPSQTVTALPAGSFTVTYQGLLYYCEPQSFGDDDHSDCVRYYGGSVPYVGSPDLYCSDSSSPECSEDWYPVDLARADMVTIGSQTYVCRRAVLGSLGDKDCARYSGGDPNSVSYGGALKCSTDVGSLQCDSKYYPSEMKGLSQVRISYQDYLCKSSYGGKECWKWSSYESPKQATMGLPDLYCNSSGTCAEGGYPRGY